MNIKTKQDIINMNQMAKEIVNTYIESGFKIKGENPLDMVYGQRLVKRCDYCSGFSECIDDDGKVVVTPHADDCTLAILMAERSRQLSVVANTVDLLDGSHNVAELMSRTPRGSVAFGLLNDIRQRFQGALNDRHYYLDPLTQKLADMTDPSFDLVFNTHRLFRTIINDCRDTIAYNTDLTRDQCEILEDCCIVGFDFAVAAHDETANTADQNDFALLCYLAKYQFCRALTRDQINFGDVEKQELADMVIPNFHHKH